MASLDVGWSTIDNPALFLVGGTLAFLVTMGIMPGTIRKLIGARIVGRDRNKAGNPEVAEMGGLGVFAGFACGALALLAFSRLGPDDEKVALASLLVAAGATMTGILDDLISLQQKFKAILPVAFAIPLALFAPDSSISTPWGVLPLGLAFPLIVVPLAVTCGANSFNMLEGFNGLGTGMGILMGAAICVLAWIEGNFLGFIVLVPLVGALLAFVNFNWYPARVFPGDTMTLLVGATLVTGAILSQVEFWAALLFAPYFVEFALKARARFKAQCFATGVRDDGKLYYVGPTRSLTHGLMRGQGRTESGVTLALLGLEAVLAAAVIAVAWASSS